MDLIFYLSLLHFDILFPKNSIIIQYLSIFKNFGAVLLWKDANYIENEGLKQCQFSFANFSKMSARIFMKF